ncbi:YCF48-related protein [Halopseudomonas phragmitis]|uniref:Glycosyl hydrolase n=1 Tax=Halopseudomonas phragmitis TaxID=1931241 RepID=A0A1V0B934_9GAMM|nr:YCF48-related protein [Halopseudomonas phragmitis]AQZ96456.1 glycosyl hydrolase [Halopseudomonas phragmitis]
MSKLISYSFCLVVAALVVFAFSPRSEGLDQQVDMDLGRVQINDLVQFEGRVVAVGERGSIILSDDLGDTWRTTHSDRELPVTLTGINWLGEQTLIAVGHDELMLRSDDAGESWQVIMNDSDAGEPLLGSWTADGQKVFAYGSFGRFFISHDAGYSWEAQELDLHGEHLNDLAGDGQRLQMMVGEMGLVLRSEDYGQSWSRIEPFYRGSLFGVAHLQGSTWVTYGMRGHVFVSHDDGMSWNQLELPHRLPLYGHAVNADGIVIVGTGGAYVNVSRSGELGDLGFMQGLGTLTSAVVLPNSDLFVAGQRGLTQKGRTYLAVIGQ